MVTAVVFAYSDVGARCLRVLLARRDVRVLLVVSHHESATEIPWFESVAAVARCYGIPLLCDETDVVLAQQLAAQPVDFIFSFYYRRILSAHLLQYARRGAYNMHGSLLPRYRGCAPVNWAITQGETQTGVTWHRMVAQADAGGIIDQMAVPILPDDTAYDVSKKITVVAELVLHRTLSSLVRGEIIEQPNDTKQGEYCRRRVPADGLIHWSYAAQRIHNLVRAVAPPFPGAFFFLHGHRIDVHRTRLCPRQGDGQTITVEEDRLIAYAGDGAALELCEVAMTHTAITPVEWQQRWGLVTRVGDAV